MRNRFRFEKLEVWQAARQLNKTIYQLTRNFPKYEMFAMTSQIRRAAVSISSNIAEGSGRNSDKDFGHFLEQAYGSLMEVAATFFLAWDEGYVSEKALEPVLEDLETLSKRIASLNRSLKINTSKTPFARQAPSQAVDHRPSTLD